MKSIYKIFITALSIVLICTSSLSMVALAEEGVFDTEAPTISLKAEFDLNGDTVNGDALEANVDNEYYIVKLTLSNIQNLAIFNLTAEYTDDITITEITTIASTRSDDFVQGAVKNDENKILVIIGSTALANGSSISGTDAIVTLKVRVHTAGDFSDFFTVSTASEETFVQSCYGANGEYMEMAYVWEENEQTETDIPKLHFDMSPDISGITVTGTVVIATNLDGTQSDGIPAQEITVVAGNYEDAYYTPETLPADAVKTVTAADGTFTLEGVPDGTTAITIVGPTTTNRVITIADGAMGEINAGTIPVNVTDYNHSGGQINGLDLLTFNEYYFKSGVTENAYYKYADLNGSTGTVNGLDLLVFNTFYFKGAPVYAEFVIGE